MKKWKYASFKSIKISEKNHAELMGIKAHLTLDAKEEKTLDDAVSYLLELFFKQPSRW